MIRAAAVLAKHPSAVLFDFSTRFPRAPREYTRNERSRLVVELIRDPTTRVATAANGWLFTPSSRDIALWDQLEVDRLRATPANERANLPALRRPWVPERASDQTPVNPRQWRPGARARIDGWVKRQNLGGARDR